MGIERSKRPQSAPIFRPSQVTVSTAPSTALATRGIIGLVSTSTVAPVVYTLTQPKSGDVVSFTVDALSVATSAGFNINAGTGVVFAGTTADMVRLSSMEAAVSFVAKSSARWYSVGDRGAIYSTST